MRDTILLNSSRLMGLVGFLIAYMTRYCNGFLKIMIILTQIFVAVHILQIVDNYLSYLKLKSEKEAHDDFRDKKNHLRNEIKLASISGFSLLNPPIPEKIYSGFFTDFKFQCYKKEWSFLYHELLMETLR